ncbi:MAG: hypothetical protein WCJ09_15070 [Planctomycetota bacterium]
MSRRSSLPSYTHHRASGQARVRIAGRDIYLGLYGSPESHERYARLIAERAVEPQRTTRTAQDMINLGPGGSFPKTADIPQKYGDRKTSGLKRSVVAGDSNVFNFDLTE